MPFNTSSKEPLQYLGTESVNPPDTFIRDRAPTPTDDSLVYQIGDIWLDTTANDAYILTEQIPNAAIWLLMGASGNLGTLTGDIGAAVVPVAQNINVQGGLAGAISFSNGGAGQLDALVLVDGITISIVANALVANGSIVSIPTDNGGPCVPVAGSFSIFGPTSADFPNQSGIETHVGATTDQIYLENRRFVSAFIVDSSAVVGLRGEFVDIATAITAATTAGAGTVYVRPGSYAGFTMDPGIPVVGLIGPDEQDVTITSNVTINAAGRYSMSYLNLAPGAAIALTVTSATSVQLDDMRIAAGGGFVNAQFQAPGSTVECNTTEFIGTGADAIQITNGTATLSNCVISGEADASGTSILNLENSPVTGITRLTGTATVNSNYTAHDGAAAEAFDVGVGTTLNLFQSTVTSNAGGGNWVIGTGTINYSDVVIIGSAIGLAGGLTITNPNWKPYGDTAGVVGVNSYNILDFAVNATSGEVSILGSAGADSFPTDSGIAAPVGGVLQILGGPGVSTSAPGASNIVQIDSVVFTDQAAPLTVLENSGSFVTAAVVITLPAAPSQGDLVEIVGTTILGVVITANAGHAIRLGNQISGVGGTATSTDVGDALTLRFRSADSIWYTTAVIGNWTVV